MRLQYKLPLTILVVVVVPALIMLYAMQEVLHQYVHDTNKNKLEAIAKIRISEIERYFAIHSSKITALSNETKLVLLLKNYKNTKANSANLTEYLKILKTSLSNINSISLFDSAGTLVASSDIDGCPIGSRLSKEVLDSKEKMPLYHVVNGSDTPSMRLVQDIKQGGKTIGYMVVKPMIEPLNEIGRDFTGLGKTGEVIVGAWGLDGSAYYLTDRRFAEKNSSKLQKINISEDKSAILHALKGVVGFGHDYMDYRGVSVIATTAYIPSCKVGVIVKTDTVESHEQIDRLTFILVSGFLLLCVVVMGTLWFAFRSFLSRLEYSTQVACDIAMGNFDTRIQEDQDDEFSKFVRVFNGMVDSLVHIKQNLQDEVEAQVAKIRDATKLAQREEGLFKNTFDATNTGLAHVSLDGKYLRINRYYCDMVGYTKDEMLSMDFATITHPDDVDEDRQNIKMLIDGKINSYTRQKRYIKKDGKLVWALLTVVLLRDMDNKPVHFIGAVQDITHIKELEHENIELLEQNKLLLEYSGDGIMGLDINGMITFVNSAAIRMLGYEKEQLLGKNSHAVLHHKRPNGREHLQDECPIYKTLAKGDEQTQEGDYFITASDDFLPVEYTATAIYKNENIIGAVVVFRDVTYRIAMEETILKSEQKFRNLVESTSDWIWETDANGVYTYASPQVERLLGYKPREVVGKSCFELMKPSNIGEIKKEFTKIVRRRGAIKNLVNICIHKNGHDVYLETNGLPVIDENGMLVGYEGVDRDISERVEKEKLVKSQEQMLVAQSRQAAMGEMIGMIAHQWRQPITAIGMAVNNLRADIELGEINSDSFGEGLNDISGLIEHLSKTIDDFRDFFKEDKEKELASIDSVIGDAVHIISKSLDNNNIELIMELNAPVELGLFRREMIQVFLNIIKNSKDIAQERAIKSPFIAIKSEQNEQEVIVSIADNAGGISKDVLPKVFEPYFTTRGPTSGTGLGLYMSDIIVSRHHGGKVEVSNVKDGACFTVRIPFSL